MTQQRWSEVDRYFEANLLKQDDALEAALADSTAAGLPDYQVSPGQGQLLLLLATIKGARKILEIGSLGGYSTICLARALPKDGRLVTLEVDPLHARVAQANIARAGLSKKVEVRVGPALASLPQLAAEGLGPFDFIFIDADKPNNPGYLDWALKLSQPGSLIVIDNVVRNGDVVHTASQDASIQGVRQIVERLSNEKCTRSVAVQTVGIKGYDGFILIVVAEAE